MVEMTGFEPAASCSQSMRATNCATSRNYIVLLSAYLLYQMILSLSSEFFTFFEKIFHILKKCVILK